MNIPNPSNDQQGTWKLGRKRSRLSARWIPTASRPPRPVNVRTSGPAGQDAAGRIGRPDSDADPHRADGRQALCVGDLVPVLQLNAGAVSSGCPARNWTPSVLQGLPMTPTR